MLLIVAQVIVVGGGLGGMSAAHTVLQHGGSVLVLDKVNNKCNYAIFKRVFM